MHIKTMEGLVGANNNATLMKVPMSVYQQGKAIAQNQTAKVSVTV